MKLHEGHRQRVKERYLKEGLDSFQDHQVLELLLFYCITYKDTNELAHELLNKYGSLAAVFEADPKDLAETPGIGYNSAVLLSLIPSLTRIYFRNKWGEKPVLDSTCKAGEYAVSLFSGKTYEVFYAICLDSQNKVNYAALVQEGTINETPVYPRLVVEAALRHQANSVILAHNHPGGSLTPSKADMDVTARIVNALEAISIKVQDHIIVAGNRYLSFKEKAIL